MSIKPVTYYMVECDEPGCKVDTAEANSEFSAFGDRAYAIEDWQYGDNQVIFSKSRDVKATYCYTHRRPECDGCGEVRPLEADDSGDKFCQECREDA